MNFLVLSAIILFVGLGYYFSSLYLRGSFRDMEKLTFTSMSALTDSRERIWSLWSLREDEPALASAFQELEALLIEYGRVSEQDIAPGVSSEMRRTILELQEGFEEV